MPASPVPPALRALPAADLLGDLLAVSITGLIYYTPLYDPAGSGEIVDFTFVYLNPAAQRMMRMPEVPTLTHNQQWPHSIAHGTFQFHVDAFVSGEPREYNINYQADGYDNYYRLAARRSGDGLWVSFTDTADQPRTPVEVALRESQARESQARAEAEAERQRFYEVLMQLPAHVAVHEGPDQVFTFVNPDYQRIAHGRELLGQPIRVVWPELASHGILAVLEQVYRTGEPFTATELPLEADFTRTGRLEQVYYDFFFLALRDAQGQVTGVLNFSYDVTDSVRARRQVEQLNQELETRVLERTAALQESEARFRIMADAAPNQVWAVNPDSTIRYVNQAFLDFVGLSLEEYVATGWSAFLPPEELDRAQSTLETAIRTRSLYLLEHRLRRHDGQYRWLLSQGAPSFYANGELYGYVGSAIDITELKQTNEQLRRTNVDLDNFIYAASHDLREPITNLQGLVEALHEQLALAPVADPLVPSLLGMIEQAIARFQLTIAQLTDVAQLQQARELPAEAVDLRAVVEAVCLDLAPQAAAAAAQVSVAIADDCALSFAPQHLRSLVYNLLSNALKYRHASRLPWVALHCRRANDTLVLEVSDNGLGLDTAQQARLFGLFQRLHTHVEGSGIGLYMVKRIAENAGGHVRVQSQLGVGSTFTVVLPARA